LEVSNTEASSAFCGRFGRQFGWAGSGGHVGDGGFGGVGRGPSGRWRIAWLRSDNHRGFRGLVRDGVIERGC